VATQAGLRERKKEQTRAAIAHAAIGLFLERGFEAVSIAEIAEAAGVAKMTVTNYFPAKEDLVLARGINVLPDLAAVVRGRPAGQPPVAAIRQFVQRELDRRSEWTLLHDGVTAFARMTLASPTLTEAFARRWAAAQRELARAMDPAAADQPANWDSGLAALIQSGPAGQPELRRLAAAITTERISARMAAAQIVAVLQALAVGNLVRQAAGLSADETAAQARAETEAAFTLLESGLAGFDPAPGR
jgi:AcrR family transcriptional regulator